MGTFAVKDMNMLIDNISSGHQRLYAVGKPVAVEVALGLEEELDVCDSLPTSCKLIGQI